MKHWPILMIFLLMFYAKSFKNWPMLHTATVFKKWLVFKTWCTYVRPMVSHADIPKMKKTRILQIIINVTDKL